jgi:predicted nucleotidyltransferase
MELDTLITFLQTNVSEGKRKSGLFRFLLFGSFGKVQNPSDVDLLIIFNDEAIDCRDAVALRRSLVTKFRSKFGLDLDVSLLSETEARGNAFAEQEGAVQIWG